MEWIDTDIPVGRNIRNLRIQRGMSQSAVAARLQLQGSNMSRDKLSKIENGKRNIKASDLILLKELFRVDFDAFFISSSAQK